MDASAEKCRASSEGRSLVNLRAASCPRLSLIAPALLLAACSSAPASAPSAPFHHRASFEARSGSTTDAFKRDIERLASTRFGDVDALETQLQTRLGPITRQGRRYERTADGGTLGGLALRNISLRSAADDPRHANLSFEFAAPGIVLRQVAWDGAVMHPPHPDAPGSRAHWNAQLGDATVVLGLDTDDATLVYVSISQH